TVNNKQAARALPHIKERLLEDDCYVPLVGDFHYNGHKLLVEYPEAAKALAKFRINPGNTGTKTRDENFCTIVEQAIKYDKPVRIGVNLGSLVQLVLTTKMDTHSKLEHAKRSKQVM